MAKKEAATGTDKTTLDLIAEVNRQKELIAKLERPNYNTNMSFSYSQSKNDSVNLQVENRVQELILIADFLQQKAQRFQLVGAELGVENPPAFTWQGHTLQEWVEDIKTRVNKIQIASRRKKLEVLEARLNAVISPELRTKLELEAIQRELGNG